MECELRALQYEVSLNGVKEEIRHVLGLRNGQKRQPPDTPADV